MAKSERSIGTAGLLRRFRQLHQLWRERRELEALDRISCDSRRLARTISQARVTAAFRSRRTDEEWGRVEQEMTTLGITEKAGGVNPGDRRALYYLVRGFGPRSVLEVGTHIGASTMHIAAALRKTQEENSGLTCRVTTVDIMDVNDSATTPWLKQGSTYSPVEMAQRMGVDGNISFVTSDSLAYFETCGEEYDLIFLDGDHTARTVYQEIPAALSVLRHDGLILLHDYFPALQPLWDNDAVIPGPWLATERLRSEGADFQVLPMGELPWPTKLGSRTTSLALLVGN